MALVQKSNLKRTIVLIAAFVLIVVGGGLTLSLVNRIGGPDVNVGAARSDLPIPSSFNRQSIQAARDRGLKTYGTVTVPDDARGGNPQPFSPNF